MTSGRWWNDDGGTCRVGYGSTHNNPHLPSVIHGIKTAIMSKIFPIFLTILLCAAAILPAAAQSTNTINGVFDYDKAKKVVKNINNIRQSQGLRPLKMYASLTEAAMLRAAELAFQREGNGLYNANTPRPNSGSEGMLLEEQCPSLNFAGDLGFACAIHPFTDIGPIVKMLNQKTVQEGVT